MNESLTCLLIRLLAYKQVYTYVMMISYGQQKVKD